MSESQAKSGNTRLMGKKSIPEHIIDGSIAIDSIEAYRSILQQFPRHPALLKKYADLLFRRDLLDLAAKSYDEAARLFIESGQMLPALVAKKQQWLIKPPAKEDIRLFLAELAGGNFQQTPIKVFLERLPPRQLLAVMTGFVRVRLLAGKIVRKAGQRETDLYFIVSGTLKDSVYPSLETKERIYRKARIDLSENDFFGDIYPFKTDQTSVCTTETLTEVEMVKISRQKLMTLCRKYPDIELAIINLFKIRRGAVEKAPASMIRKAERYQLPIKMKLEVASGQPSGAPLVIDGYSSDISIGGICVILNGQSEHMAHLLGSLPPGGGDQVRVRFPGETMELKVQGNIAWHHKIHFNGTKTLALGIQFEEDSPKLQGMLFMFANSLGGKSISQKDNRTP